MRKTTPALLIAALLVPSWLMAAIPLQVNHQGHVAVNGVPFNGDGGFRFALVDPDSTNNVWTNDGTNQTTTGTPATAVSLPVINGIYNVRLGDTDLTNMTAIPSTVFNDDNIVLRIWFDDGTNGIQQLAPDHVLTATPYAFHAATADDADTVDGMHAADLGRGAPDYDSGWFAVAADDSTEYVKDHNLGDYPSRFRVMIKASTNGGVPTGGNPVVVPARQIDGGDYGTSMHATATQIVIRRKNWWAMVFCSSDSWNRTILSGEARIFAWR